MRLIANILSLIGVLRERLMIKSMRSSFMH
jgi:hypothetical protein